MRGSEFSELRKAALALYRTGRLPESLSKYEQILKNAIASGNPLEQARALWGIGNCRAAEYDYTQALQRYSEGEQIAVGLHEPETAGLIRVAMSDAYQRQGESLQAQRWIRAAIEILPPTSKQYPSALIHLAVSEADQGAVESADYHFSQGIQRAESASDWSFLQNALNHYGRFLIETGQYQRASEILEKAAALNQRSGSPYLAATWMSQGRLSFVQGNPKLAIAHLDRAISAGRDSHQIFNEQSSFYWRAVAEAEMGSLRKAIVDFETARQQSRAWRRGIPLSGLQNSGPDVWLTRLYDGYLAAAMRLFTQTKNPALLVRMFELAEERRFFGLQQQIQASRSFPAEYWRAVAKLRSAELSLYRNPSYENRQLRDEADRALLHWDGDGIRPNASTPGVKALVQYRHRVLVPNGLLNDENFSSDFSLLRYKDLLSTGELYLSFHVGDRESYLWLLTTRQFELFLLPGRADLEAQITAFRDALTRNSSELPVVSRRLYQTLFGQLPSRLSARRDWILSLDGVLFDLPFAALQVASPAGGSQYLVERNSLRIIPGIDILDRSRPKPKAGSFVGIGDPIYNTADSRYKNSDEYRPASFIRFGRIPRSDSTLTLARLPGSGREVEGCARVWPAADPATVLSGRNLTREKLEGLLSSHPAVLHIATHVVQPMAQRELAIIAIGLDARGQPDFLTPTEIAAHQYKPGLVVLTGCSSGRGKALPGVGLLGLTRAWLLSGGQSVVASHWPTPDESGDLFQQFYKAYPFSSGEISSAFAASALRSAQIAMLRSGSWRAKPQYWAGFYVMGKD